MIYLLLALFAFLYGLKEIENEGLHDPLSCVSAELFSSIMAQGFRLC